MHNPLCLGEGGLERTLNVRHQYHCVVSDVGKSSLNTFGSAEIYGLDSNNTSATCLNSRLKFHRQTFTPG